MAELSRELATQGSSVIPATAPDPAPWRRFVPKMWYAHLTLWIACAFVGFPLIYAVLISTQSNAEVANFTLSPGTQFNENWHQVMVNRFLGDFMLRSVILSVVITVGKTILALLSGLAFVYFRFPGKWIVFAFVLATLMMPTETFGFSASNERPMAIDHCPTAISDSGAYCATGSFCGASIFRSTSLRTSSRATIFAGARPPPVRLTMIEAGLWAKLKVLEMM